MRKLRLLDCTLRDGGYVNDWNFGFGSIKSIFSRLDDAGIDAIEIGFIDERRSYDSNRSIYPDTKSVEPIFHNIHKPHAFVTAMIDYGTCSIDRISPASESHIDGIRVIFKKHIQDEALAFISQIKEKGYKIIVNPVSVTSYSDEEMLTLIKKINKLDPYLVTIVDTYGLMHSKEVLHYCKLLDNNLNKNIILAYHAHNNFQLAYANAIAVINSIKKRDLVIDGTLFGMGKSAGNACTELIAMYMNECCGKNYNINQIQEAIDIDIIKEFNKKEWGYRPLFYISALHDCHPNYVAYLIDKKTLSVKQINEILDKIPSENDKKLLYDRALCEKLYQEYQNVEVDDTKTIKKLLKELSGKDILLIGPGKSITTEKQIVDQYIKANHPVTICVSFLNKNYPADYVFMSNAKRYSQFFDCINEARFKTKIICTSNVTKTREKIDFIVNFASLISEDDIIRDNPLVLLINLLNKIGIKEIYIAGFDGYENNIENNYFDEYLPFLNRMKDANGRNKSIKNFLKDISTDISIKSLTKTKYL